MIWRVSDVALRCGVTVPWGYRHAYDADMYLEHVYAVAPLHLLLKAWHRWQWPRWTLERWLIAVGVIMLPPNLRPPTWPWGWNWWPRHAFPQKPLLRKIGLW